MAEAGAGTQGHDQLGPRILQFYAEAVDGSTHRPLPTRSRLQCGPERAGAKVTICLGFLVGAKVRGFWDTLLTA